MRFCVTYVRLSEVNFTRAIKFQFPSAESATMASFSEQPKAATATRAGWQVKKLDAAPAGLSPRGGATICSTSVGLIIFGGK